MHRHGYKGRKLGREKDRRLALMRSLSVALVEHGSIETTLPKAKELRPRFEKLVSKAKIGDLHNRRQLVSALNSVTAAHKMVDQIAPAMQRTSGYLRIEKTRFRRGDNARRYQWHSYRANRANSSGDPKSCTSQKGRNDLDDC